MKVAGEGFGIKTEDNSSMKFNFKVSGKAKVIFEIIEGILKIMLFRR